jgi:hypothetical protein
MGPKYCEGRVNGQELLFRYSLRTLDAMTLVAPATDNPNLFAKEQGEIGRRGPIS